MKNLASARRVTILLAVGAFVLSGFVSAQTSTSAAQTPLFSFQELGDIGNSIPSSAAESGVSGINNAGDAVGGSGGGTSEKCPISCAVIWHDGTPTVLAGLAGTYESGASSINNVGQVAGTLYTGLGTGAQAVIWNNGSPTLLPNPGARYTQTIATALNDVGQVVGEAMGRDTFAPLVWDGLTPTILGTTPDCTYGYASGINNSGIVVGTLGCNFAFGLEAPFFWRGTVATRLQVNPNFGTPAGSAIAVNESGLIVGNSNEASKLGGAFYQATAWTEGGVTNLGPFPDRGYNSTAGAVNNKGIIVGQSYVFSRDFRHAALWTSTSSAPLDLNKLIDPAMAHIYALTNATGINDSCTIVADGVDKRTLFHKAFLLKLTDPSMCVNGFVNREAG